MPGPNRSIPRLKFSDFERFFQSYYFKKDTGCWIWTKYKTPPGLKTDGGYGIMGIGTRKCYSAHRVSYKLFYGGFKKELDVLHKCDNKSCVNPNHLFLGNDSDNQKDRVNKGKHDQAAKTHCIRGHEFNEENMFICRNQRYCRQCQRIRYKKWSIKNAKNKNSRSK